MKTNVENQIAAARLMLLENFVRFKVKPDTKLWSTLIQEEAAEVVEAYHLAVQAELEERDDAPQLAADLLKELSDVAYVIHGLELACFLSDGDMADMPRPDAETCQILEAAIEALEDKVGANNVFEAFKRVHASNMSKLQDDGTPLLREDGKVLKGPNYKPPYLLDLVS